MCKSLDVDQVKRGPRPQYPDSYIITLLIIKNLLGINSESALLRHLGNNHGHVFERLPERSWFNRKARKLFPLCEKIIEQLLEQLDLGNIRVVDSTPVPVCKVYRGAWSKCFPRGEHYQFGYCASKKEYYYGVKMTLITNELGIPTNWDITRANKHDLPAFKDMLNHISREHRTLVADKGYYDGELRAQLHKEDCILVVPDKKRHHQFNGAKEKKLLKNRGIIETAIEQLKSHMKIHEHLAQSYQGIKIRIQSAILSTLFAIHHNITHGRSLLAIKSILM